MAVTEAYIAEIERRINAGTNGDVKRIELALLDAIYKKQEKLEQNPAFAIGEFIQSNKGLSAFLFGLFYVLNLLVPDLLLKMLRIAVPVVVPEERR